MSPADDAISYQPPPTTPAVADVLRPDFVDGQLRTVAFGDASVQRSAIAARPMASGMLANAAMPSSA